MNSPLAALFGACAEEPRYIRDVDVIGRWVHDEATLVHLERRVENLDLAFQLENGVSGTLEFGDRRLRRSLAPFEGTAVLVRGARSPESRGDGGAALEAVEST